MAEVQVKNVALDCSDAKKVKLSNEDNAERDESVHESLKDLSAFQFKRVLNSNTQRKLICVEGTFADREGAAIVLLEKNVFAEDKLAEGFFSKDASVKKTFQNDIYGSYQCFPLVQYNGVKTTVIHPATQKHITKFESKPVHLVVETPKLYKEVTLPHLEKEQFSLEWVYNILELKSETERIVFKDLDEKTGFIMVPDLKWDQTIETLYLLAIPMQRGIKSIRDLNESHLPLLRNIQDAGCAVISEKYKLPSSQLRIYLHYQPSFYHLHVHFTYLKHEAPGIFVEKAHLLSTVINNIELVGDYYTRATLSYVVKETDSLFTKYQQYGVLPAITKNEK